jgi:hypothetical protein
MNRAHMLAIATILVLAGVPSSPKGAGGTDRSIFRQALDKILDFNRGARICSGGDQGAVTQAE